MLKSWAIHPAFWEMFVYIVMTGQATTLSSKIRDFLLETFCIHEQFATKITWAHVGRIREAGPMREQISSLWTSDQHEMKIMNEKCILLWKFTLVCEYCLMVMWSRSLPDCEREPCKWAVAWTGILAHGVTSYCPTLVTSPPEVYHRVLPLLQPRQLPGSSNMYVANRRTIYLSAVCLVCCLPTRCVFVLCLSNP
jgi:hypothetical protein